jgi:hypothetical protein
MDEVPGQGYRATERQVDPECLLAESKEIAT